MQWQGRKSPERWLERRGVCSGIYRTFEPTCNAALKGRGGGGGSSATGLLFHSVQFIYICLLLQWKQVRPDISIYLQTSRCYLNDSVKTTQSPKVWVAGLCERLMRCPLGPQGALMWYVRERKRQKRKKNRGRQEREREQDGEEERCNEARLRGWTQSVSLPSFFQYPLLMKFHLDCKCSVIYHHKCVMGPWIQWHCAG